MNISRHLKYWFVLFLVIQGCANTHKRRSYDYSLHLIQTIPLKGTLLSGGLRMVKVHNQYRILDTQKQKIYIYSLQGKLIDKFGNYGEGPEEFEKPVSITADENGLTYVLDQTLQRVSVFDEDGKFMRVINVKGNGLQMLVEHKHIYLYNSSVFYNHKLMVSVFDVKTGKKIAGLNPASNLIEKFRSGFGGASIMGLAFTRDKLVVLQHPMQLRIRIYDPATDKKLKQVDLTSDFFQRPDFKKVSSNGQVNPQKVGNAFVSGFFAGNNKVYMLYTEFGTGTKYMDVFSLDGVLQNKKPIKLDKKFPRYLDNEGYFYSFAWVDSTGQGTENANIVLKKYELNKIPPSQKSSQ